MHEYTAEEIRFIKSKIAGRGYAEMTELFNRRFGLRGRKKLTLSQMKGVLARHKLRNGRDCRFRPGQVPPNKGRKGYCPRGSEKGWFKPGNRPHTWRPVGTEIVDAEGYVKVKTRNPGTWKLKQRLIWEKAYGKVPRGHAVIFADGNRLNFALDNLLLISRSELAVMNRRRLISTCGELTRIGKTIADLRILAAGRKEGIKKRARRVTKREGG